MRALKSLSVQGSRAFSGSTKKVRHMNLLTQCVKDLAQVCGSNTNKML